MNILSIQSSVAYGHVGNSAAVLPLQRAGLEVWPVNTVHFSTGNQFGLEYPTGSKIRDPNDALQASDKARLLDPETVLTTSLRRRDSSADPIEMLAVSGDGARLVETPLLPPEVNGAGDATAAPPRRSR